MGFGAGCAGMRNEPMSACSRDWVVVSRRTGLCWETIWMEKKKKKNTVKKTSFQMHITEKLLMLLATLGKKTNNPVQGKKQ